MADTGSPGSSSTPASEASESTGTTEASEASEGAESKTAPTDVPAGDDREVRLGRTVGVALLLAVPPGVGMAIGVGVAGGLPPTHPLVIGGGAGLTLAILALVLRSVLAGTPDPARR